MKIEIPDSDLGLLQHTLQIARTSLLNQIDVNFGDKKMADNLQAWSDNVDRITVWMKLLSERPLDVKLNKDQVSALHNAITSRLREINKLNEAEINGVKIDDLSRTCTVSASSYDSEAIRLWSVMEKLNEC